MNAIETGQVVKSAAEVYEEFYIPALFQEWAGRVADAAGVAPGQRVLDVACGTGVLARTVAERVGQSELVVGLDVNEAMLAVARRKAPEIEWRQGRAESLPFDSESFDAVVSQFGLMFFEDKPAAIKEMVRVLKPDGRLAVAVWDRLERSPGYAALADLLQRLFGDDAAATLRAPYYLGDTETLRALFEEAGVRGARITTHTGTARFDSIRSLVITDVKGWTLAGMINDEQLETLLVEAERELKPFVTPKGKVAFEVSAHIVTRGS